MSEKNYLSVFPDANEACNEAMRLFESFRKEHPERFKASLLQAGIPPDMVEGYLTNPTPLQALHMQGFLQGIVYAETYYLTLLKGLPGNAVAKAIMIEEGIANYQSVFKAI